MKVFSEILARLPGLFSVELGIDVAANPQQRQRWFLAAILFGGRISGKLAAHTYKVFAEQDAVRPEVIVALGWDRLVTLLDRGGYTRCDYKTATKLLAVMGALVDQYEADLERLHDRAQSADDLEVRLQNLGAGIGPVTVNIFLRELRGIWSKADPPLSFLTQLSSENLGILPSGISPRQALETLQAEWRSQPVEGRAFSDLEAALVRLGRDFCRKKSDSLCPLGTWCRKRTCPHKSPRSYTLS
ncbi:hypothetical protein [Desulfobacca acetoxidans]|uniref:Putative cytoplasmic protein n=1 Tax=Desulfobacca acetoxidans (strain ATCC 700848 / DSM 11109 / ASRB2) TaxID=880072 RepID=F2NE62_DESAR|nr:hypothetical protein [Desulfobacca acetoxidans]AEB10692.1 putative cytoplasmic protein [Desulfobacca acetoxidans DSM 11109]